MEKWKYNEKTTWKMCKQPLEAPFFRWSLCLREDERCYWLPTSEKFKINSLHLARAGKCLFFIPRRRTKRRSEENEFLCCEKLLDSMSCLMKLNDVMAPSRALRGFRWEKLLQRQQPRRPDFCCFWMFYVFTEPLVFGSGWMEKIPFLIT